MKYEDIEPFFVFEKPHWKYTYNELTIKAPSKQELYRLIRQVMLDEELEGTTP